MPRTQQERFTIALQARGETIVSRGSKFISMTRQAGGYYYLGCSGSLRYGRSKTHSVPVSDLFKSTLLALVSADKRRCVEVDILL